VDRVDRSIGVDVGLWAAYGEDEERPTKEGSGKGSLPLRTQHRGRFYCLYVGGRPSRILTID
jgi:hypothetical protein